MVALEIAGQIGESPGIIKEKNVQWATEVVKKGVIVDLHIGRTRFLRKMTKEDLGLDISDIEFQKFLKEYYDLGAKLLIPKKTIETFNRIENRGRNNLRRYSFLTPWGLFVPSTAYRKWKEKNEKIRQEYYEEAENLRDNFGALKAEILEQYRKAAPRLWERTSRQKNLDEFVGDFLHRIEAQIPDIDTVMASIYYREDIYYIPLPTELEEEMLRAEIKRRELLVEQARTRAEAEKYAAEVAMHRDVIAKMMEMKKQKVDSMLESISKQLRGAIYSTLRDVLESIKTRSVLTEASVRSLKNLVEKTRLMNFLDDSDVENALAEIEKVLEGKNERNAAEIFHEIASGFRACAIAGEDDLPEVRQFLL